LYASWSSFQHEVPYNQCMEEHHHCLFYLPHCVQIALPGQQQFSATKKKQMSSDDATGKPRGTASNSVLCSVLSASQSPFQNDHQYSTQCMEEHRHTSMLALKQRSLLYRSFHNACAEAEIAREQVLSRCLLHLLREILHQNCNGVLVRIFQPNLSPIPPQSRQDFRSLKQLSSHNKSKLRGFKRLTQISPSLCASLVLQCFCTNITPLFDKIWVLQECCDLELSLCLAK
jgi:hypothetical protein